MGIFDDLITGYYIKHKNYGNMFSVQKYSKPTFTV